MSDSKVTFNENIQVKYLHVWLYAHKSARRSDWETAYLDALRFQDIIKKSELIIQPILQKEHRAKILQDLLSK